MATRIPFVDQLKAISIILIVYIHNDSVTILSSFFNTFNLHLFFILSGFVRKDPVSVTFWDFVRRNGRRLLWIGELPYGFLPVLPPLLWLGRNTLPILAFHLSALALIKAVALLGFDSSLPSGISYYWLYTTLQIIILIPLVLFLNRFAPWMVGLSGYGLENKSKSAS